MIFSLKTNFEPEATFNVDEAINSLLIRKMIATREENKFLELLEYVIKLPHPMTTGGTERVALKNEVLDYQNLYSPVAEGGSVRIVMYRGLPSGIF